MALQCCQARSLWLASAGLCPCSASNTGRCIARNTQALMHRSQEQIDSAVANLPTVLNALFDRFAEMEPNIDV